MRLLLFVIVAVFSGIVSAHAASHFFVVDASASMDGSPMLKAKDTMRKIGKSLFAKGDRVAVVLSNGECSGPPRVMPFVSDSKKLDGLLNGITTIMGDGIAGAFEYAQHKMEEDTLNGHIYMFGDGDGIDLCKGVENIAQSQQNRGALTPFTYVGLDWDAEEKTQWRGLLSGHNMQAEDVATFDYNEIANYGAMNKQYFTQAGYVNSDGSSNDGANYADRPWQCIQSDGLLWYAQNKSEQHTRFFIKGLKSAKADEVKVKDYVDGFNVKHVCGREDWRLTDYYELKGLAQLRPSRRDTMFPYVLIWPHISATGGEPKLFRRGINLDNGGTFDYRENRPYAAIFVAGDIDTTAFKVPDAMIQRSQVVGSPVKQKRQSSKPSAPSKPSLEDLLKQFDLLKGDVTASETALMSLANQLLDHPQSDRLRGDKEAVILYKKAASKKYKSVAAMNKLAHYYDPRYLSPHDKAKLDQEYSGTATSWHRKYAGEVVRWYGKAIRYHDMQAKKERRGLKAWAQTDKSEIAAMVLNKL